MRQLRQVSQQILRARNQHRDSFKADLAPTMQAVAVLRKASRDYAEHLKTNAPPEWFSGPPRPTPSAPTSSADDQALLQAVQEALATLRESRTTLEAKLETRRMGLSGGATTSASSLSTVDRAQVDVRVLSRIEVMAEAATDTNITDAQRRPRLTRLIAELRPAPPDDPSRFDHVATFVFEAPSR